MWQMPEDSLPLMGAFGGHSSSETGGTAPPADAEEDALEEADEWVRQNLSDLLPTPPDFAAGEVVAYRAK